MYDDEPSYYDPFAPQDNYDEPDSSSRPSCLFVAVSVILIASLIGTSLLTYFLLVRRDRQAQPIDVDSPAALIDLGPTAAPATVVAAAAASLSPLATVAPVSATPPTEVDRIALINDDGQLETMRPNGEDRRVLTLASDNTRFQFPTWAPDGHRLAIIGSRGMSGGIYILNDEPRTGALDSRRIYDSTSNTPIYLYWSPDSRNLAFLANYSRSLMSLNVIAGDGSAGSRLLATGAPFYWDWTDDGGRLLIHSGQQRADNTLALIDLEGDAETANLAVPGEFQAPGVGDGGRYWAFAEQADGGLSSLVIVDTRTGERTARQSVGSLALGWSPAGDRIAYTNAAPNGHPYWGPLHILDVTNGDERIASRQTVLAFFWSPDGRQIAFITINSNNDIDEGVNALGPRRPQGASRMAAQPAAQFRQGFLTLSVIDVETGHGLRLLDFEPTRVYLSQFLPFFDQYALSHSIWSPDSTALVLPVREDGDNVILVVPTVGGRPHRLAAGDIAFWSHN